MGRDREGQNPKKLNHAGPRDGVGSAAMKPIKAANPASDLEFSRSLLPKARRPSGPRAILSAVFGLLSMVPAGVNLAALFGRAPEALPRLVKKATEVILDARTRAFSVSTGDWYVPDFGFWVVIWVGVVLATIGLLVTRRRRVRAVSAAGLALNVLMMCAGSLLTFTDRWETSR
jgi:hypothetical protein